jgi:hypothetical protein
LYVCNQIEKSDLRVSTEKGLNFLMELGNSIS